MTFLTLLIALWLDSYPQFACVRRYHWMSAYTQRYQSALQNTRFHHTYWEILFIVLPPVLLIALISIVLHLLWFGLAAFVFNIIVLLYCLGSNRLGAYIKNLFGLGITIDAQSGEKTAEYCAAANVLETTQILFSILLWFILLGAAGAFLYRMLLVLEKNTVDEPNTDLAAQHNRIQVCLQYLDWLPLRVLVLCLSLTTHFMAVFRVWWQNILAKPQQNEKLLQESFSAACEQDNLADCETAFDRSVVVFLILVALMTIASFIH